MTSFEEKKKKRDKVGKKVKVWRFVLSERWDELRWKQGEEQFWRLFCVYKCTTQLSDRQCKFGLQTQCKMNIWKTWEEKELWVFWRSTLRSLNFTEWTSDSLGQDGRVTEQSDKPEEWFYWLILETVGYSMWFRYWKKIRRALQS